MQQNDTARARGTYLSDRDCNQRTMVNTSTQEPDLLTSERLLTIPSDVDKLRRLLSKVRRYRRDTEILAQGQPLQQGLVLVEGWAMRLRLLSDGRCQVISFLLPLDLISAPPLADAVADHSLMSITDCKVAACPADELNDLCNQSATLHAVFAWLADHDAAVLKEHIVALGQRDARERVCWLLYEIWQRLDVIGLAKEHMYVPLSRTVLADALGVSVRHLARVLLELHTEGVVQLTKHNFRVLDPGKLREIAEADGQSIRFGENVRLIKSRLRQALGGH